MSARPGVIAVEAGDLSLGGGLLALVRPALSLLDEGGVLAVLSRNGGLDQDLPSWCRAERHEYLGAEDAGDGARRHLIGRGSFLPPAQAGDADALPSLPAPKREGFQRALFGMKWDNPAHRRLLELEGLREWMPPREEGYRSLEKALQHEAAIA